MKGETYVDKVCWGNVAEGELPDRDTCGMRLGTVSQAGGLLTRRPRDWGNFGLIGGCGKSIRGQWEAGSSNGRWVSDTEIALESFKQGGDMVQFTF